MLQSLETEIARAKASGDKEVAKCESAIRSVEINNLSEGDTWTFPTEYKRYQQKIGNYNVYYIWIEVKEANGNTVPKKFYLSTFTKVRFIVNEDKTLTGERAMTEGTATKAWRDCPSLEEGLTAMKGKTVKVTKINEVRCLSFDRQSVVTSQIPTIDFVEEDKCKSCIYNSKRF